MLVRQNNHVFDDVWVGVTLACACDPGDEDAEQKKENEATPKHDVRSRVVARGRARQE
jgi:hypothetical protein